MQKGMTPPIIRTVSESDFMMAVSIAPIAEPPKNMSIRAKLMNDDFFSSRTFSVVYNSSNSFNWEISIFSAGGGGGAAGIRSLTLHSNCGPKRSVIPADTA